MTLIELRAALKEKTGRLDLLDVTLDEYINQGTRLLDELETSGKRTQRVFQLLEPGTGNQFVTLPIEKRWIDSVHCLTATQRWELTKLKPSDIRNLLHNTPVESGPPAYYSWVSADLAGVPSSADLDFALSYDAITLGSANNLTYLLIAPVDTSEGYQIEVEGTFYTPFLSATNLTNRWSELYSYILLQAATYWMIKDTFDFTTADQLRKNLQQEVLSITHDAWSDENFDSLGG